MPETGKAALGGPQNVRESWKGEEEQSHQQQG